MSDADQFDDVGPTDSDMGGVTALDKLLEMWRRERAVGQCAVCDRHVEYQEESGEAMFVTPRGLFLFPEVVCRDCVLRYYESLSDRAQDEFTLQVARKALYLADLPPVDIVEPTSGWDSLDIPGLRAVMSAIREDSSTGADVRDAE